MLSLIWWDEWLTSGIASTSPGRSLLVIQLKSSPLADLPNLAILPLGVHVGEDEPPLKPVLLPSLLSYGNYWDPSFARADSSLLIALTLCGE